MGFFKSKDEIPKLPKAPSLFDLSTSEDRSGMIPELPSFPNNSDIQERFNQQMVKSAVNEYPDEEEDKEEIPEITHAIPSRMSLEEEPKRALVERKEVLQPKPQKETIFVKIDKFNAAQKSIDEIQTKVVEISKAIEEMKKVKNNELEELNEWDEEMKNINLRLSKIDKGIFGEV